MDNFKFLVQSEGREVFNLAFEIMFQHAPGHKASHYLEHPEKGFLLFWHEDDKMKPHKLPFAMDWKTAADLVWGWLGERKDSEYREYCDHDGSNGHGFKIYNEAWGHIDGTSYAFLAVLPIWCWYGK